MFYGREAEKWVVNRRTKIILIIVAPKNTANQRVRLIEILLDFHGTFKQDRVEMRPQFVHIHAIDKADFG